jgi:GTPase
LSDCVILVYVTFRAQHETGGGLAEFEHLAYSADLTPLLITTPKQSAIHPKTFIRKGVVDHLALAVKELQAPYVLFNHDLRAGFKRELEKALNTCVIDRTELILDVFSKRAKTYEGKLQVELAQLNYLSTRLVRGWTHLERQKGGLGLRGPGETQLETDRRLIRKRVHTIEKRLARVASGRHVMRQSRAKKNILTIALVGYTNAGKSTVFNALTHADTHSEDRLFATLDSTLRYLDLPSIKTAVLIDTVGFIEGLPHHLVKAFRGTLEEVCEATLLLHVVDASDPNRNMHQAVVASVLKDLNADEKQLLTVYNKVDVRADEMSGRLDTTQSGLASRVWISGQKKTGLAVLKQAIEQCLDPWFVSVVLRLPASNAEIRQHFYRERAVCHEAQEGEVLWLYIKRNRIDWARDLQRFDVLEYVVSNPPHDHFGFSSD